MTKESIVRLNKDWEDFKSLCGRVVCEKNKVKYATVSEVVIHGSHVRAWHGLRSTVISFDESRQCGTRKIPSLGLNCFGRIITPMETDTKCQDHRQTFDLCNGDT